LRIFGPVDPYTRVDVLLREFGGPEASGDLPAVTAEQLLLEKLIGSAYVKAQLRDPLSNCRNAWGVNPV
jgi:hypothetical protein